MILDNHYPTGNNEPQMKSFLILICWLLLTLIHFGHSSASLPPADHGPFSYLALGDSYTIGENAAPGQPFPHQLARSLRRGGIDIGDPRIIARTGWTTGELMAALRREPPDGQYDLVTLLIGVNNQYRGYPLNRYSEEFTTLLKMAEGFAGRDSRRVVVISIPDWGVTPFAGDRDPKRISREIRQYNRVNRRITHDRRVVYVNITRCSRKMGKNPRLVAPDGLHPSGDMYRQWVDKLLPVAVKILHKRR